MGWKYLHQLLQTQLLCDNDVSDIGEDNTPCRCCGAAHIFELVNQLELVVVDCTAFAFNII